MIIQKAVRRNPRAPDFSGLDQFMASTFDETGGVVVSGFDKYVAEEQRTTAMILKQTRLWSEEQASLVKKGGNQDGGDGGGGGGRGGGAGSGAAAK